ncbi:MAG: GNAT family N-acetyltransferase [Phototrophicales bacterium]|nr:MAG: GNAT family N-acetyltransferase [Phototrophicales bacterium]
MRIRPAKWDDAAGIARMHVSSWQTSYPGIIPQHFLDTLSVERRTESWQHILSDENTEVVLVAEADDGEILGFVSGGKERESVPGYDGELYAIYLLKDAQGKGIGYQLFKKFVKALTERGYNNMVLWVFRDNRVARQFYENLGGQLLAQKTLTIAQKDVVEVAHGWKDIKGWLIKQG